MKIEVEENSPANSYIRRVKDVDAVSYVNEGEWQYAPKSLWKEKIRDIRKEETISKSKKKKKGKEKT
jgi:hypothetical protein|tara:strand:- start:650 stop:850 length:201 start_codon:yes stop_codon:yes gene_type:complete